MMDVPETLEEHALLQKVLIDELRAVLEKSAAHAGIQVNALLSCVSSLAAASLLPPEHAEEEADTLARECFFRLFDAASSLQDYVERKAPWRMQSSQMKRMERTGGLSVRNIAGDAKRAMQ